MISKLMLPCILFLGITGTLSAADDIRMVIGEKKYLHFPGLKKFENLNPKLIRAQIAPKKEEVLLTALTKGHGQLKMSDASGERELQVIIFSKLALDYEREIEELTRDIEGIEVRQVGRKVLISGEILTPQDLATLKKIETLYEDVMTIAKPTPYAQSLTLQKMIQMDVKLVEIDKNDLKTLGIEFPKNMTATLASPVQFQTPLEVILHALDQKGWANIIAQPQLTCKNHESATFLSGGEIPIRIATKNNLSVQWKPYGISLKMKPHADDAHHIETELMLEVSDIDSSQTLDGLPGLLTRRVETKINVNAGETIVISGLMHTRRQIQNQGVAFLSSIPILGHLFGTVETHHKDLELMVFVTPSLQGM